MILGGFGLEAGGFDLHRVLPNQQLRDDIKTALGGCGFLALARRLVGCGHRGVRHSRAGLIQNGSLVLSVFDLRGEGYGQSKHDQHAKAKSRECDSAEILHLFVSLDS